MARLARIVLPGIPHHVTQRGNGRAQTFFSDADYRYYRDLLVDQCGQHGVSILGWCLMPNHVHLILTPPDKDALRGALSRVHRMYAGHIHAREKRTGHFWQGRFGCVAMDEDHLVAAMAYVALNPVRAKLVEKAEDWPWSSVHAYRLAKKGDGVTNVKAAQPYLKAARQIIKAGEEDVRFKTLRQSETIGRPIGNDDFLRQAEQQVGRALKPGKRGPKP
ncbi:MAG: transposase [Alphaproteobacteria bacterium]|nr:transposase [Alphaproteobacteria bacterium]MBF0251937.1 transposase [Alphaproteobacteria bacterium]